MTKTLIKPILTAAAALVLASCSVFELETPEPYRVTIMYAPAMNNLSPSISEDLKEFCSGYLPTLKSGDVFLVYSHMPAEYGKYKIPTEPVLFRAWRDPNGTYRRDTLIRYPSSDLSSTPEVMNKVLTDIQNMFPAPHYGMIVSSHGKGWLPAGYEEKSSSIFNASLPETRELCIENFDDSGIDVNRLSEAIPYKLDYLILDACLMGCIETAYELRGICDLLLFSPTEIMSDGLMYQTLAPLIMNVSSPDIVKVAQEYFDHYNSLSGSNQSATVTVLNCNKLERLAQVCGALTRKYRSTIAATPHDNVKRYFYNDLHWFFDLRDIYVTAGISKHELRELNEALDAAIIYSRHTEEFFAGYQYSLYMEDMCGLSMYKPYPNLTELNDFYKTLAWNKAIGLIQ
ncbi:MAG: hypothetical protein J5737_07070 [Bacteroidales bacterium]|nr:hypothetical protein [Bacteroidales bacterium]